MNLRQGDGTNATVGSLYAQSAIPGVANAGGSNATTIDQAMENGPSTSFMAQLNGEIVYYNPYKVNQLGDGILMAGLMHEALHNLDATDPDLMANIPNAGVGSYGISLSLLPCLPW